MKSSDPAIIPYTWKVVGSPDDAIVTITVSESDARLIVHLLSYMVGRDLAGEPTEQLIDRIERALAAGDAEPVPRSVVDFTTDKGFPPTLREIGEHMGIRSTNGVNDHLNALERKGYIERKELQSRGIRVVGLETHQQLRERCAQMEAELEELRGDSVITIPILRGLGRSVDAPRRE